MDLTTLLGKWGKEIHYALESIALKTKSAKVFFINFKSFNHTLEKI